MRCSFESHSVIILLMFLLTLNAPKMKIIELARSVGPDEVAHYEPPHLDQHCLPSSL